MQLIRIPIAALYLVGLGSLATTLSQNVRAENPPLVAVVGCDSTTVTLRTAFQCSLTLQNSGDVALTSVKATAGFVFCLPDGSCCVCLIGSFPLGYVAADPQWTGRTFQYGFPFWDPLGNGSLAPGQSATASVTVFAGLLRKEGSTPGSRPAVCLGGSANGPQGGSTIQAGHCVVIDIVEPPASNIPADVNCDGAANSLDALLILQHDAGLLPGFPCPDFADANWDDRVNVIDAALILQASAGLIRLGGAPPITDVTGVSMGHSHTCIVTAAGGAKCWGENFTGSLGDGTTRTRLMPRDVEGLASGVAAISAGRDFSCAVTLSDGVKCWGENGDGQLGIGVNSGPESCSGIPCSSIPADGVGLSSGVVDVSVGGYHTCVLTSAGGVKCWGRNFYGQLGDGQACGYVDPCMIPVDVTGLTTGIAAISAGYLHTCALTAAGGVKCWGNNGSGDLGDGTGTMVFRVVPTDVAGLTSGVRAISAGYNHTCAIMETGAVKCWGDNSAGELGNNTSGGSQPCSCSDSPVDVSGLTNAIAISAGSYYTCVVTNGGGVKCWGANSAGQLGTGTDSGPTSCNGFACSTSPVDTSGLTGVVKVAAGQARTCALLSAGGVKCWGATWLGNGRMEGSNAPVDVVQAAPPEPLKALFVDRPEDRLRRSSPW